MESSKAAGSVICILLEVPVPWIEVNLRHPFPFNPQWYNNIKATTMWHDHAKSWSCECSIKLVNYKNGALSNWRQSLWSHLMNSLVEEYTNITFQLSIYSFCWDETERSFYLQPYKIVHIPTQSCFIDQSRKWPFHRYSLFGITTKVGFGLVHSYSPHELNGSLWWVNICHYSSVNSY